MHDVVLELADATLFKVVLLNELIKASKKKGVL
jgi:hypothetical protein